MKTLRDDDSLASSSTHEAAVPLFHALADPTRLEILRRLDDGELRVVDLTTALGLAQSTVSAHLSCLRSAGLIAARPQGRATHYAVTRPEVWDVLGAAEVMLAAQGSVATLCPVHHRPAAHNVSPPVGDAARPAHHGHDPARRPGEQH